MIASGLNTVRRGYDLKAENDFRALWSFTDVVKVISV